MRPCAVFLMCLAMMSCVSAPQVPRRAPLALSEARVAEIRTLIGKGAFLEALQEIHYHERDGIPGASKEDLASMRGEAVAAAAQAFSAAIAAGRLPDAWRLYDSLACIGEADLAAGWSRRRLLESLRERFEADDRKSLALLIAFHALSEPGAGESEFREVLAKAEAMGDRGIGRRTMNLMAGKGFSVPESATAFFAQRAGFERMLSGTVTVWVDKGIKIEKGMGYPERVIGSGFFIDAAGYLLTNYHVIQSEVDPKYEGFSRLYLRPSGATGERIPAKVVGYDPVLDLALLKAEMAPSYVFSGAGSVPVVPGQKIYAIGSPVGLEKTLTSGIVSAVDRRFLELGDAIQVDAPLNPGNSGGPLLNEEGDLTGVVFAGLEQYEGINFAVPYPWIEKILPRLYLGGEVPYGWMGAALTEADHGLEILYTVPGEPADKAGLAEGDVVEAVDGVKVATLRDIQSVIMDRSAPSLVRCSVVRGDRTMDVLLCLSRRPENPVEACLDRDNRDDVIYPVFGMKLEKISGGETEYVIRRVVRGSVADESGISVDDPVAVKGWVVDREKGYAVLQIFIKKQKSGFLESVIQIAAYLSTDSFL